MPVTQIMSVAGRSSGPPPPPPPPPPFDGWYDPGTGYWYGGGNTLGLGTQVGTALLGYAYPDGSTGQALTIPNGAYMISTNMKFSSYWSTNAITIDIWFYPTANGIQILSEQDGTQTDNSSYHYSILEIDTGNHIKARFYDGATTTSEATVTLNAWNHVYFWEDTNGGHELQVNGVRNQSTLYPTYTRARPTNGEYFCIGLSDSTNMGNSGTFQGKIGQFWIRDYVATSTYAVTKSKYQPPALLVNLDASNPASYTANSTTWYNLVSGGHDAYFNTAPAMINLGSKSLDFAGSNWAVMPGDIYFDQDFTIVAWVRLHSYANWSRIIDFGNGAGVNEVLLAVSDGTLGRPALRSEDAQFTVGTPLPVSKWTQVVGRLRGDGLGAIFFNGSKIYEALNITIPVSTSRTTCYIGKSLWSSDALLNGEIGELQIYHGALSDTAININYNATKSKYPDTYSFATVHSVDGTSNDWQGGISIIDSGVAVPQVGWSITDYTNTATITNVNRMNSRFGFIYVLTVSGTISNTADYVALIG